MHKLFQVVNQSEGTSWEVGTILLRLSDWDLLDQACFRIAPKPGQSVKGSGFTAKAHIDELEPYHFPEISEEESELLALIADRNFGFETLETRNSDDLDFGEVSVWSVKKALAEAFEAGRQSK